MLEGIIPTSKNAINCVMNGWMLKYFREREKKEKFEFKLV